MSAEDGYIDAVVRGLCIHLGEAGVGVLAEAYPPALFPHDGAEPILVWSTIPKSPTRVIAVRFYQEVVPTPGITMTELLIQVRTRVGPDVNEGLRLQGAIRTHLHEQFLPLTTGARVTVFAQGLAELGPDVEGNFEHTRNFRVIGSGRLPV